jgi:hypothetical protein
MRVWPEYAEQVQKIDEETAQIVKHTLNYIGAAQLPKPIAQAIKNREARKKMLAWERCLQKLEEWSE